MENISCRHVPLSILASVYGFSLIYQASSRILSGANNQVACLPQAGGGEFAKNRRAPPPTATPG